MVTQKNGVRADRTPSNPAMRDDRPNILYLVHRVPYPPNRGDRIRSYHLLRFLAGRSHVHLATLADEPLPAADLDALKGLCARVAVVPLGGNARWARAAWTLAAGRTATEGLFRCPPLERTIRSWAVSTRLHAVVVFCSSMMQYMDLPELRGVPAVVDLVDVDSQKFFDYADLARGMKRHLFRLEGRRLRGLERSLATRATAVTLVSEAEAELFRTICPAANVLGVPNGVDLDYFHPAAGPGAAADAAAAAVAAVAAIPDSPAVNSPALDCGMLRCVFTGVLDYRANVEGLRWFCSEVWPEVRRRLPEAAFAIVGRRPTDAVRQLAHISGVELIGEVPDVRPYLRQADVAVAPLQTARGLQNKVLEAMAMGLPVVATPQALEGLDLEPGADAVAAATPAAWADALAALTDANLRRRLGRHARQFVEARHSWQACLMPWERLLNLASPVAAPV